MAIQKTVQISRFNGLEISNAYIKIRNVLTESAYDEEGNPIWLAHATVDIYPDEAARDAKSEPLEVTAFSAEFPANQPVNGLVWAYNTLKSQARFAGAVDV